jgi:hypothetical protein
VTHRYRTAEPPTPATVVGQRENEFHIVLDESHCHHHRDSFISTPASAPRKEPSKSLYDPGQPLLGSGGSRSPFLNHRQLLLRVKMIPPSLSGDIDQLIRRAHSQWLEAVCAAIGNASAGTPAEALVAAMPATNNFDAAHNLASIIRRAEGLLTWEALGTSIHMCSSMLASWTRDQHVELLWTGPSPASQIPARRIDQVFVRPDWLGET